MDVLTFSFTFILINLPSSLAGSPTCEEISVTYTYDLYHYHWYVWSSEGLWHNMSFWGGHVQIPSTDDVRADCFPYWDNLLVLTDNHPDVDTMNEDVVTLQACSLNQNRICEFNVDVEMRKCNGDLLYRFPWFESNNPETWYHYICFDRIYRDTCDDTETVYVAGNVDGKFIHLSAEDIQTGWFSAFNNGKQYVLPSTDEVNEIYSECFALHHWGYFLKDPLPELTENTIVRLTWCEVWSNGNDYGDETLYHDYCGIYIYVRLCNGKVQFDISHMSQWGCTECLCFVHHNNVIVKPEIRHELQYVDVDGRAITVYNPFLQYRCSFDMTRGVLYKTNWYINGTFEVQMGPSSRSNELVFKEEYLNDLKPGYEVHCGVVTLMSGNESIEALSDAFYAGWKIADSSITLSKSGYVLVDVEQTIPLGCYYTDDETPYCGEELVFEDPSYVPEACTGGIRVQNVQDASKSFIEIQSLMRGDEWTRKRHRAKLTTIDSDYDDQSTFDMQMTVTHNTGRASGASIITQIIGAIHVDVTQINRHWNKRCYSHVDPHMKTIDGLHYEAQEEGDYMMVINDIFQTEIQTSARYCTHGYTFGPVCACGIAVAVGADVFVFNRCPDSDFRFDLKCRDGGIIDIERIHDYRYMVRTPTGTIIDIFLHTWSDTMNIDIYMSAKDFGNVAGLCGDFDGDSSNDLLHRDRQTVSNDRNRSYRFADSWRLTDEENLFKNEDRFLKPWDIDHGGTADQPCKRSHSITKKKCEIPRRKKRSVSGNERRMTEKHEIVSSRKKRSTGNFTDEEAFLFCNNSIYTTAAVQEFPDKLAGEDPDIVVEQCVYDLTQGNDTAWVEAHVTVLNNAADAILMLNPVYVANNTDIVNLFRLQTCLNDCSGNGACAETGLCECNGTFRGPDCSIDIRIPPVVYNIEGGICEITEDDDCTCFQIRTNNIFDGFMCDISKNKVYFNGTNIKESHSMHTGDYKDIFTGECCVPEDWKGRPSDNYSDELFVAMYEFAVSNDGVSYGDTNPVYIYDTTCLQQVDIKGNITFGLKEGYCFIDATCVVHNSKLLLTDECYICYPATDPYSWTKGNCDERKTGVTTASLIGIITGSVLAVAIIGLLVYLLCCKGTKKNRTIRDSHTNLQATLANIYLPGTGNIRCKRGSVSSITSVPAGMSIFPDISVVCAAKPIFKRNMWISSGTELGDEPTEAQRCNMSTEGEGFQGENSPESRIIDTSQSFPDMREDQTPIVRVISVASLPQIVLDNDITI